MAMFRLVFQRNFGLAWWGGLVSMLGDWMLSVSLPIAVYELTGSAAAVSTIVVARLLPALLLGPFAGVLVDRWNRQLVMIVTNLLRVPVFLALLLVDSSGQIWVVQVVVFLASCASQFFRPAENALMPELVDDSQLIFANTLNSLNNNIATLLGPAAGGLIAAWGGLSAVAAINASTFLIAAALLSFVRVSSSGRRQVPPPNDGTSRIGNFFREWMDGLRQIPRSKHVSVLFLVAILLAAGNVAFTTLLGPFVVDTLKGGSRELGWLLTAQGAGGIAGGLVLGWVAHRRPPFVLLGWSVLGLGLLDLLLYGYPLFITSIWIAVIIKTVMGLPVALTNATSATLLQQETPAQYRGRIFSALDTSMAIVAIVAAPAAGIVAELVGLVPVLVALASFTILAGMVLITFQRTEDEAFEGDRRRWIRQRNA